MMMVNCASMRVCYSAAACAVATAFQSPRPRGRPLAGRLGCDVDGKVIAPGVADADRRNALVAVRAGALVAFGGNASARARPRSRIRRCTARSRNGVARFRPYYQKGRAFVDSARARELAALLGALPRLNGVGRRHRIRAGAPRRGGAPCARFGRARAHERRRDHYGQFHLYAGDIFEPRFAVLPRDAARVRLEPVLSRRRTARGTRAARDAGAVVFSASAEVGSTQTKLEPGATRASVTSGASATCSRLPIPMRSLTPRARARKQAYRWSRRRPI